MKTILVNGIPVKVCAETFKRIEKFASEKNVTFSEAVNLLLEKVI